MPVRGNNNSRLVDYQYIVTSTADEYCCCCRDMVYTNTYRKKKNWLKKVVDKSIVAPTGNLCNECHFQRSRVCAVCRVS